jgi:hypothetical protein
LILVSEKCECKRQEVNWFSVDVPEAVVALAGEFG